MKKNKVLAVTLSLALLASSITLTACGEDQIKFVKQKVVDLSIYTDAGMTLCDDFERDKVLSTSQAATARSALKQVKDALNIFIERARTYTKIDGNSKAELARLFADVVGGVREVIVKAKPLLIAAITALGVRDVDKLLSRVNVLLTGLETTARLIESRLVN